MGALRWFNTRLDPSQDTVSGVGGKDCVNLFHIKWAANCKICADVDTGNECPLHYLCSGAATEFTCIAKRVQQEKKREKKSNQSLTAFIRSINVICWWLHKHVAHVCFFRMQQFLLFLICIMTQSYSFFFPAHLQVPHVFENPREVASAEQRGLHRIVLWVVTM